jgi:hypothetical protein
VVWRVAKDGSSKQAFAEGIFGALALGAQLVADGSRLYFTTGRNDGAVADTDPPFVVNVANADSGSLASRFDANDVWLSIAPSGLYAIGDDGTAAFGQRGNDRLVRWTVAKGVETLQTPPAGTRQKGIAAGATRFFTYGDWGPGGVPPPSEVLWSFPLKSGQAGVVVDPGRSHLAPTCADGALWTLSGTSLAKLLENDAVATLLPLPFAVVEAYVVDPAEPFAYVSGTVTAGASTHYLVRLAR